MHFSKLEISVLKSYCCNDPDRGGDLRSWLSSAVVNERENTGYGFFTRYITRPVDMLPFNISPISGPRAFIPDLGQDFSMSFLLWMDSGYPKELEGFQCGKSLECDLDLKKVDIFRIENFRVVWE